MNIFTNIYKISLTISMVIFFSSCAGKKGSDESNQSNTTVTNPNVVTLSQKQFDAIGITTGSLIKKNLSDVIKLNGLLEIPPMYRARITAMINGSVSKIVVKQGDVIKKGDVLALISHPDIIQLQQDFLETQSQFGFYEKDFLRKQELIENNATAPINYEKIESDYYSQKYKLLAIEKKLKLINLDPLKVAQGNIFDEAPIVSPIGGSVNSVNINIGSSVSSRDELFEISDNSKIQATLLVYEKDIPKIKIGQPIQIALTSDLTRTFTGQILSISKGFEKDVNAIKIYANINGKTEELLHGSNIEARLDLNNNLVDALPDEALIREGENMYIFIMSGKNQADGDFLFKRILVKTGISDLGYTEITPLTNTKTINNIVLKGAYELNAKMKSSEMDED
jgi:cobalt-zinc-cadmium efflux system membrane fusion protein